jgi:hypothetical protein
VPDDLFILPGMKRKQSRNPATARRARHRTIPVAHLTEQSQSARDRGLHVLAAMRHDPSLSLTHAARLQGVKPETVKKYFPAALKKTNGKFQATKGDRYAATLYVPDAEGKELAVKTRSSKEREQLGRYLRDLGRYLRGNRNALAKWQGKKIAGVELVTDKRTLVAIEPALSDFSLYHTFTSGRL